MAQGRIPIALLCRECFLGSEIREWLLIKLLEGYYASKFRRDWIYRQKPPHFGDHRADCFEFAYAKRPHGPYVFLRGFFVSEILHDGDRLLDIGCGDGFFPKRFYSERCSHVDAIDIDRDAIRVARSNNAAPNITYALQDAVALPFPNSQYDVDAWDGAIGHFARDDCSHVGENRPRFGSRRNLRRLRVAGNGRGRSFAVFFVFGGRVFTLQAIFSAYRVALCDLPDRFWY